jgi:hypothetical protein
LFEKKIITKTIIIDWCLNKALQWFWEHHSLNVLDFQLFMFKQNACVTYLYVWFTVKKNKNWMTCNDIQDLLLSFLPFTSLLKHIIYIITINNKKLQN